MPGSTGAQAGRRSSTGGAESRRRRLSRPGVRNLPRSVHPPRHGWRMDPASATCSSITAACSASPGDPPGITLRSGRTTTTGRVFSSHSRSGLRIPVDIGNKLIKVSVTYADLTTSCIQPAQYLTCVASNIIIFVNPKHQISTCRVICSTVHSHTVEQVCHYYGHDSQLHRLSPDPGA